jgi:hypothetical protein
VSLDQEHVKSFMETKEMGKRYEFTADTCHAMIAETAMREHDNLPTWANFSAQVALTGSSSSSSGGAQSSGGATAEAHVLALSSTS